MLYLLCGITLAFLIYNIWSSQWEWINPSVVFCAAFLAYEGMCLVAQKKFAIKMEPITIAVIVAACLIFTLLNHVAVHKTKDQVVIHTGLKSAEIFPLYVWGLIFLQILSIVYFIKYITDIAVAYEAISGVHCGGIGEKIQLYDTMTKFWTEFFSELNIPIPMIYRVTNPICGAMEYLVLYLATKKIYFEKRISISYLIVFVLMVVRILMNGSRSPLLRVIAFSVFLYLMFLVRDRKLQRFNLKIFIKLVGAAILLCGVMIALLFLMGRGRDEMDYVGYIFTYVGAPLVNLNTFLRNGSVGFFHGATSGELFGAHTFRGLYRYAAKIFHFAVDIPDINYFTFSDNDIEIGNVYTMFYTLLYDFGYFGTLIFTAIMAAYYVFEYQSIKQVNRHIVDLRLFLYAYLFNDLIMSTFSNRFYETIFDAPFIKFVPLVIIFDLVLIEYDPSTPIRNYIVKKKAALHKD